MLALTRRFLGNALASSLAMVAIFAQTGCSDDRSQSFDRLMHARIYTKDHHVEFEKMIKSFVAEQRAVIAFANFPRDEGDERTVANFQISLDKSDQTYLIIMNFLNKDQFDIGCYCHEGEAKWRPFWDSFIFTARTQLGDDKVEIIPLKNSP